MSELDYSSSDVDRDGHPAPPSSGPYDRAPYERPPYERKPRSRRKKKLPPQETIDKIWSRFSAPKFTKATAVLPRPSPDVPNAAAAPPGPNNLLVSEDFERAVQECRTRVRKLAQECRRVNMRYRDATFDIDWDLKWGKGDCLNGLARDKFEMTRHVFLNPNSSVPKAVKRVHEIFDKPTFLKDQISPADVKQGNLGDCWLMASLTALANMEVGIQRICVEYDTSDFPGNCSGIITDKSPEIGIYGFVFHRGKFKVGLC
jgi:hypothetical protein